MLAASIIDYSTSRLISRIGEFFLNARDHLPVIFLILAAVALLTLSRRVPILRTIVSIGSWLAIAWLVYILVQQQGLLSPGFAGWSKRLGGPSQRIVGDEVRIKQSRDGHFWARVRLNGVERRLLIDSGATVTALSSATARAAGVEYLADPLPVVIRTANGNVTARSGKVKSVRFGTIRAANLGVVVSPALGDFDVLGMNFLSRLKGWRVEDGVLILTPHHPAPETPA